MREATAPSLPILVPGDEVTWEITYTDGSTISERRGAGKLSMKDVDRIRIARFALVAPGELLFECSPPPGADGRNLIYRRRTTFSYGAGGADRHVIFLIGWVPMGPAIMIDPKNGRYREEAAFILGDPEMHPPELEPADDGPVLVDLFQRLGA